MRVLFLSHTAAGGTFVVGSHHLSRAMARLGHEVSHLSPPVTPAHLLNARDSFVRRRLRRWLSGGEIIDGVRDLVPFGLLPWGVLSRLGRAPHRVFGRLIARSVLRQLNGRASFEPDLILIDEPRLSGLLDLFPAARVVYRPTDLYADIRGDDSIGIAERELVQRADAFIATSEPVAEHLRALGAAEVLVIENGVDVEHFATRGTSAAGCAAPGLSHEGPVAIYAGAFDHRFGTQSVIAAAKAHPHVLFVLGGPSSAALQAEFADLTNVRFPGPIGFDTLPAWFRASAVGLLPMSDHPSNAGRSPMKLYEYAAAGLPVVATWTPELARRGLSFVSLARSPEEFAARLGEALLNPCDRADCIALARSQGWQAKCEKVLGIAFGSMGVRTS